MTTQSSPSPQSEDLQIQDAFNRKTSLSATPVSDDEPIWKTLIDIALTHKLLIALSVFLCLLAMMLYLRITPPVYSRYSTILVDDAKKGGSGMASISDEFADMGLFNAKSNVVNDIQALKSPYLMYLVVKKLNLHVTYTETKFLRTTDLYKSTPLVADFPSDTTDASFSFQVRIISPSQFELSQFAHPDPVAHKTVVDEETRVLASPYKTVVTPVGSVILSPVNNISAADSGRVITIAKSNPNKMADACVGKLGVDLADKLGSVVNLSYKDQSARRAEDILNTLYDLFLQEKIDKRKLNAAVTSKFIDSRLQVIEQELGSLDHNIEQYKSGQLITNVTEEGVSALTESNKYSGLSLQTNNQLEIAKFIKECLNASINGKPVMLPVNAGLNESVGYQIASYNELVMRRDKLVSNSSERNPLVAELDASLKQMQASILNSLENLIHSYVLQLQSLKGKESQIQTRISKNPKQEMYLQTVGRQQKIKESLYLFLLQKREENELQGNMMIANISVITPPRGSDAPVSPVRNKLLLMAILAGLAIPVGIYWFIQSMDDTVRGKKDIAKLSLPYLGTVPLAAKINDNEKGTMPVRVVVQDGSRDAVNEAFRVLRANFNFMAEQDGIRLVSFTSYFPNSGKTFLATNLALSLAHSGKKVLLVDLDLRKAELSKNFADKRHGISSLLRGGDLKWTDCVTQMSLHQNLYILPCGVLPPNPAELLLRPELQTILTELKDKFDYVFLDCTPLNIVADGATVCKQADMVVFSIREGLFHRDALPDLEALYKSNTFHKMACVLNGSMSANGAYGRYHYGKYGYGKYGQYGYGDNKK